jgi:hypothetical protein
VRDGVAGCVICNTEEEEEHEVGLHQQFQRLDIGATRQERAEACGKGHNTHADEVDDFMFSARPDFYYYFVSRALLSGFDLLFKITQVKLYDSGKPCVSGQ